MNKKILFLSFFAFIATAGFGQADFYRIDAEKGDAVAQYKLGDCYFNGKGVTENHTEAVHWYRKAAEQGHVYAQNSLGNRYYHGQGVPTNHIEAVNWYRKAAEQGYANAQYNLASMYYNGTGVKKDNSVALYWYRKALLQKKELNRKFAELAETRTKKIKITLPNKFSEYAKTYVQNRINAWQLKGEYEKTADWQARVNELTRKERVNAFAREAEEIYVNLKHEAIELSLGKYDPDNEVYLVKNRLYGNLLVYVPEMEAPAFRANWNSMKKTPRYFIENDRMALAEVSFTTDAGKSYAYSNGDTLRYIRPNIVYNFEPINSIPDNFNKQKGQQTIGAATVIASEKSDVDINIPVVNAKRDKTFAVIIANENYPEAPVNFALNDGRIFREYCQKTLGLPESNIKLHEDATLGRIIAAVDQVKEIAGVFDEAEVIVYYAGHGVPDKKKNTYLLPVDGSSSNITATGYSLERLYTELSKPNLKTVTVFLDACFSGAQRGGAMLDLEQRGTAVKPKQVIPSGNTIVFSATQGDETAYSYREKGHGMFTYFLLKKLQESKGEVTLGELGNYIATRVRQQAVMNSKSQTPTVSPSPSLANWQSLKLK